MGLGSLEQTEMKSSRKLEDEELLVEEPSILLTGLKTSIRQKSRTIRLQWAAVGFLLLALLFVSILSRAERPCSERFFTPCMSLSRSGASSLIVGLTCSSASTG